MNGSETRVADILIIGYGNRLRGDDGAGLFAAEELRRRSHDHWVEVIFCQQLMPELAEKLSKASLAIFIDASVRDPGGAVVCHRLHALDDDQPGKPAAVTHFFSPAALLATASRLYGRAPQAYAFTVGGEFFGFREGLSDEVEHAMPELIDRVMELVAWWEGRLPDCIDTNADDGDED